MRINVIKSSMPSFEEYCEAIKPLWDSVWLTNMGENHEELARRLCDYLKVDHVSLFVNGHMALEMVLQAMDLDGEVITTPFTFASTTHAIVRNNLTPVFCDIDPDNYTMDVSKIESLITDRTCAIVPVHVYGGLCDVEAIDAIAKKYDLKVVYDAAHAFGTEYKGKGVGSFGDASMFSFHATKVFHTIEGGAVTTSDQHLMDRMYKLKDFGIKNEEIVDGIGANAKMNEFCAVMGLCNLNHIDEEIGKRKVIVERYRDNLEGLSGIKMLPIQKDVKPNYAYFPIIVEEDKFGADRQVIIDKLKENDIYTRKYFYPLTNDMDCYKGVFNSDLTPVAKLIAQRAMTLPLSASLSIEDTDRICSIIRSCKGV